MEKIDMESQMRRKEKNLAAKVLALEYFSCVGLFFGLALSSLYFSADGAGLIGAALLLTSGAVCWVLLDDGLREGTLTSVSFTKGVFGFSSAMGVVVAVASLVQLI